MASLRPSAVLWSHLLRYRREYFAGVVSLLLGNAFLLDSLLVLRGAVDSLSSPAGRATLTCSAVLFVALAVGQCLFPLLARQLFLCNARRVEHDLRGAHFRHLIHPPTHQFEAGRRGNFTTRATHDLCDEVTSAADQDIEALIERALDTLFRGCTSLVGAHRLATVRRADRVPVLHRGRIAGQGSHRDLLAPEGMYHKP